jgi:hypothetical protein
MSELGSFTDDIAGTIPILPATNLASSEGELGQHLCRGIGVSYGLPNNASLGPAHCHVRLWVEERTFTSVFID